MTNGLNFQKNIGKLNDRTKRVFSKSDELTMWGESND